MFDIFTDDFTVTFTFQHVGWYVTYLLILKIKLLRVAAAAGQLSACCICVATYTRVLRAHARPKDWGNPSTSCQRPGKMPWTSTRIILCKYNAPVVIVDEQGNVDSMGMRASPSIQPPISIVLRQVGEEKEKYLHFHRILMLYFFYDSCW